MYLDILVGLFGGGSAYHKASTYTGQHNTDKRTYIHTSSGIRTHDPSVQMVYKTKFKIMQLTMGVTCEVKRLRSADRINSLMLCV